MTHIPDLWWSPSKGLFHRFPGEQFYRPILNERGNNATWRAYLKALPADAVRLGEEISDFIRVGETVSTEDRTDTYRLANGPQAMYLEPVDFGDPHIIELREEGWTIKHPLPCRADLFACGFNAAARFSEPLGGQLGRFRCHIDDDLLVIDEEVS